MDLFSQETLLRNAEKAFAGFSEQHRRSGFTNDRRLPACQREPTDKRRRRFPTGRDIGVVPKSYLPSYKEFQEERWFTASSHLQQSMITIGKPEVPLDCYLIFEYDEVRVGIEILRGSF